MRKWALYGFAPFVNFHILLSAFWSFVQKGHLHQFVEKIGFSAVLSMMFLRIWFEGDGNGGVTKCNGEHI